MITNFSDGTPWCFMIDALFSFRSTRERDYVRNPTEILNELISRAWDPKTLDHEGLGSEPRFRKDEGTSRLSHPGINCFYSRESDKVVVDVRVYFQTTLQNSIDDAVTNLRAQANPETPKRHLQLENRLKAIQKIIAQDWIPEEAQETDKGSSSTAIESQAVLSTSTVNQAKQDAREGIKPDHQGASDGSPEVIRIPSLSRLGKVHEVITSPNSRTPADTSSEIGEKIAEKISKILQEADPTQPDLIIDSDIRSHVTSREQQLNVKEMVQSLARVMKAPTRSKIDTPHSRAIRSASWDALIYLAYFNPKAEAELLQLYEKLENQEFLSAHVLNLYKRFVSSDFSTITLQKTLSELEVPKEHAQYADFFQFHDRFLTVHPVAQERFEKLFREHKTQG
ncbi:uncharacterized protein MELLADRAFT_65066 [Melampsora larici-populina 98AG31]|uniref:Uncharacterized protein n=1 Tax=Melampsora larici-populina (strain 98AG31 / pathotype 3-4-7) TaxID=747676 RepID=F4RTV3_MELLP|nr:uncharacterized protein MELLADRAFT_65066 [Melampsora larici-populina 98AG31]EGG04193.1 hypothetical protein MELLADRAFT_65066 [Melampsora larici-populina 98AG31]